MTEVKGLTWDFGGNRLDIPNALALCHATGWRGKERLVTAASIMTAESQRYVKAWHVNHKHKLDGETHHDPLKQLSIDLGLFQINWPHMDYFFFDARDNAKAAFGLYQDRGFQPWAAYNSGAYLKFVPDVTKAYERQLWRLRIPKWSE